MESDTLKLLNDDYLKISSESQYDLIIGNPPYYVMKQNEITKNYKGYYDGRPNIFIMFILKSIDLLKENGILSFVLPKNFLNCLYYDKTRKFIANSCTILSITECTHNYIETQQDTIILIIQKKHSIRNLYQLLIGSYTIFCTLDTVDSINSLRNNSKTLDELGFEVKVGGVVWNDSKDILTKDESFTRLIYNSDITKKNSLVISKFKDETKKNYIKKDGKKGPTIIINRGYGVGKYTFNFCLLNVDYSYLLENHVLYLKPKEDLQTVDIINKLETIINSFQNNKTEEFIDIYFGNNAINSKELANILPIYC